MHISLAMMTKKKRYGVPFVAACCACCLEEMCHVLLLLLQLPAAAAAGVRLAIMNKHPRLEC
jgi:hypothetical protein